ncbi:MAG: hypothetical protein QG551_108 [Patescibacteria group bacterium]|jgi:uncharacterized OB-fold protein|nr:hypothetical protein [Patescibacteria group bacterium]
MALIVYEYCSCCRKDGQQFTHPQPGPPQLVCDACTAERENKVKKKRLGELETIAQDPKKLASFLWKLEKRLNDLESKSY